VHAFRAAAKYESGNSDQQRREREIGDGRKHEEKFRHAGTAIKLLREAKVQAVC
jgi:hypothetical protein